MIEVEAKIKISDVNSMRKGIEQVAEYKGKENKVDTYYTLQKPSKYPSRSLRIRKRSGFYEVNFKRSLSFKNGVHAKNEIEFKVPNIDDFILFIEDFGFKKWLVKEKTTYLYEVSKNFHIELNNVKGLGWFLEIEYLTQRKFVPKARTAVLLLVKRLGFSEKNLIKQGYTKMLWDKN